MENFKYWINSFRAMIRPGLAMYFGIALGVCAIAEMVYKTAAPTWFIGIGGGVISQYFLSREKKGGNSGGKNE